MIDCWLIFNLFKPFVDIILQTYIQTLRERSGEKQKAKIKMSRIMLRVIYPSFFSVFVVIFWTVGLVHYLRL